MSVRITQECINCEACEPECPVAAILGDDNPKNPFDDRYYVKPESCVECVGHADEPRCAEACPTEGAIVWDMPYQPEYEKHYATGHEEGQYAIRIHKKKGMMLPSVKSQPYLEDISIEVREAHENVGDF